MNDNELRELLGDAVADVQPRHHLDDIRHRTMVPGRRPSFAATGAVVVAAAAAVTLFAVFALNDDNASLDVATNPTPDSAEAIDTQAVPAYFIGETPDGLRLYREFVNVDAGIPKLEAALSLLESGAADPDYRTGWAPGSFEGASVQGDIVYVDLARAALHDRPPGMSRAEAGLAIEQVIYTVQAAVQKGRLPVQFRIDGNPTDQTLGAFTSEPLAESPQLDVLALVSISEPAEGTTVSGSFTAKGVASSFEATVPWQVRDARGSVVLTYSATAKGWEGKLYPWQAEIDVSGLTPGTYTFVAMTDDPTGGAEGGGPTSDTRTIVVE